MKAIKQSLLRVPFIRRFVYRLKGVKPTHIPFENSKDFWEDRYAIGGDSGPGSYNRLATFKAEVINAFVSDNSIESVVDFGCGDGNQLTLARYPSYLGLDVSTTIIKHCKQKFEGDSSKSFMLYDDKSIRNNPDAYRRELALSQDVIFHLVEDEVFEAYLNNVFRCGEKYVVIYSTNEDKAATNHVRHRKFTTWVEKNQPDWELQRIIENKWKFDPVDPDNTSDCNFYIYHKK